MLQFHFIFRLLLLLSLVACKPERPTAQKVKERAISPAELTLARQKATQGRTAGLNKKDLATVLAEGAGIKITLRDLMKVLNQMPMELRQRYQSPDRWPELLQEVLAFEILLHEADEAGLNRDPMVLHTFKSAVAERYLDERASQSVQPSDISDEMVAEAYARRPELSIDEALVHAHIFSSDKEEQTNAAFEALKNVEGDLQRLTYRLPEQIAARGDANLGVGEKGDAGLINRAGQGLREGRSVQMIPALFAETIFASPEVGKLIGPIHTDRGYMFGFIESYRPQRQRKLEEVAGNIRNEVLREKRGEARTRIEAEILENAGFVINEEALREAFPTQVDPKPTKPSVIIPPASMKPVRLQHNDMDKRRKMLETTVQEEMSKEE